MKAEWVGIKELKLAIARNPQNVINQTRAFLVRGMAVYKKGIISNPWGVGMSGGGAPVLSGHLRDTHQTEINTFRATIGPNQSVAKYAAYVHGIEGMGRKRTYQLRPWLDYVRNTSQHQIEKLYRGMLRDITSDLAK